MKQEVGDVTVLINNAGIVTGKRFNDCPDDLVELTFKVNTVAHFWVRWILYILIYGYIEKYWITIYCTASFVATYIYDTA